MKFRSTSLLRSSLKPSLTTSQPQASNTLTLAQEAVSTHLRILVEACTRRPQLPSDSLSTSNLNPNTWVNLSTVTSHPPANRINSIPLSSSRATTLRTGTEVPSLTTRKTAMTTSHNSSFTSHLVVDHRPNNLTSMRTLRRHRHLSRQRVRHLRSDLTLRPSNQFSKEAAIRNSVPNPSSKTGTHNNSGSSPNSSMPVRSSTQQVSMIINCQRTSTPCLSSWKINSIAFLIRKLKNRLPKYKRTLKDTKRSASMS